MEKSRFPHHVLDAFVCWAVGNPEWAWEWTSGWGIPLQSGFFQVREDPSARGNREENHSDYLHSYSGWSVFVSRIWGYTPLPSPPLKKCWQDGSRHSRCSAEKGGWRVVLAQALLWYLQDCSVVEKLCDGRYWLSEAFCLPDLSKLLSCMPLGFSYLSLGYFIFRRVAPKMCFRAEKLFQFLVAETLPVSRSISIMRICSHLQ